ncbi:SDR family NAD(P)-dependent oxidoreductase [Vreelandella arcis]|uniref:NAD(P)-dependent dehydrogenase, short-chain alcohol dehydrogenase family n=1 Tax=Vreelandella arcis TaxID=416873 RepID=A0A1H0GZQ9_9GAMM|nr:SDR family oxidoreductase [Halomonas arcis]SDO12274.1 NAD(P)-dependent dehydrogenase, short-chain alcohol dehydrogenase family [Halomonas arcis]
MKALMQDRRVVVVGAGSCGEGWGNGKAAAVLYAREGAQVLAVDRDPIAAEETQRIIREEGGSCDVVSADITREEDVVRLVEAAMDYYGGIDVLHNNVGISMTGGPEETSEEEWERLIRINLTGVFLTCKQVLPIMKLQGSGSIINISSIAALRWIGFPYSAYTTSKAAMLAFTENLAAQYAIYGIRANCILPGLMDTPMIYSPLTSAYGGEVEQMREKRSRQCPMGFMGDAWDIANASLFLASDMSRYVTGTRLVVDGGLSLGAVNPWS